MTGLEFDSLVGSIFSDLRMLLRTKNNDYTNGSGDAFANFRMSELEGVDPRTGVLIRTQDKMQRLRTYIAKGKLEVEDEGWKDAINDVIGYMTLLYGLMLEAEEA